MKRIATIGIGLGLLLASCGQQPAPTAATTPTTLTNRLAAARAQGLRAIPEAHNQRNIVVGYAVDGDLAGIIAATGGTLQAKIPQLRAALIRLPSAATPARVLGDLSVRRIAGLRYAEPNYLRSLPQPIRSGGVTTQAVNDPKQGQKYDHLLMRAQEAWDTNVDGGKTPSGEGVVIAIMDTGIDGTHPDLAGKFVKGYNAWKAAGNDKPDPDPKAPYVEKCASTPLILPINADATNGIDIHGTHVAGIATAITDNGQGVAGVAPKAKLLDIKVFCGGSTDDFTMAFGIVGAMYDLDGDGVTPDVMNLSIGGKGYGQVMVDAVNTAATGFNLFSSTGQPTPKTTIPLPGEPLSGAPVPGYGDVGRTLPLIISMGNSSQDELNYPAGYPGVIAIGATNGQDIKADFSTSGGHIAVSAPGVDILSTWPLWDKKVDGTPYLYYPISGTSMAAPQAAGAVALIKQFFPLASVYQVRQLLSMTAQDIGPSGFDRDTGAGRIDLKNLADKMAAIKAGSDNLPAKGSVFGVNVTTSKNKTNLEDVDVQLLQGGIVKYIGKTACYSTKESGCGISGAVFPDIAPGTYDVQVAGQDALNPVGVVYNPVDRVTATSTTGIAVAAGESKATNLTLSSSLSVKLEWTGGGDLDLAVTSSSDQAGAPIFETVKTASPNGLFTIDDTGLNTTTASETYTLKPEHDATVDTGVYTIFSVDSSQVTDGSSKTVMMTLTRNGISKTLGPIVIRGGVGAEANITSVYTTLESLLLQGLIVIY